MGELNITGNKEFLKFLLPPGELTDADAAALNYFLLKYPYCQPLHYTFAATLKKTDKKQYEDYLQRAAVYSPKRDVLQRFIDSEGSFHLHELAAGYDIEDATIYEPALDGQQVTSEPMVPPADTSTAPEATEHEIETVISEAEAPVFFQGREESLNAKENTDLLEDTNGVDTAIFDPETRSDETAQEEEELEKEEQEETPETVIPDAENPIEEIGRLEQQEPVEEIEPLEETPETVIPPLEEPIEEIERLKQQEAVEEIEPLEETPETVIPPLEEPIEEIKRLEDATPEEDGMAISERSEGKIALESIASSDYFVFNRSAIDPLQSEQAGASEAGNISASAGPAEKNEVSRYDDDTMPYSFLWWLHKTRMEYASTYQPYVKPLTTPHKTGELNQQIIENIFHIQPELNTFQTQTPSTVEFELRRKEDVIIEKFIKEEPQIRPPQANRLDTENKARKSSEDNLELVSETLAKIYTDQMLYHKAIETYKKLSLKFPEKKLYFAGQIEELEKKIS